MKNLKLELFNFKKNLTFEQSDVAYVIEGHLNGYTEFAEKQMVQSLNERLKKQRIFYQVLSKQHPAV